MVMKRQVSQDDAKPLREMVGRQGTKASSNISVGFAAPHESPAPAPTVFPELQLDTAIPTGLFSSEHLGDSHSFAQTGAMHIKLFLLLSSFLSHLALGGHSWLMLLANFNQP